MLTDTKKQEILRLFKEEGLSCRQIRERLKWGEEKLSGIKSVLDEREALLWQLELDT